jgi:hypothetical protein
MSVKLTYEYYITATVSGNVNKDFDDYFIDATSGNITMTLPSAAATGLKGKIFTFRRIDTTANTVTIAANGSDNISGLPSIAIDNSHVLKVLKYNNTTWRRVMETKKTLTTAVYTSTTPAVDASIDVAQLNTASNNVALSLPLANSVALGTRYIVVTTSASNTGTVVPSGSDTINGATSPITVALNVGKTFFATSSTSWRQF